MLAARHELVYLNHVLKGKLMESPMLIQQAQAKTKKQFEELPNLDQECIRISNPVGGSPDAFVRRIRQNDSIIDSDNGTLIQPGANLLQC